LTVPQIIRKNKEKAWNMLLNVKAVRSRITDSKQEISFAASKWLKKITSSLVRNLNSNPPKYIRLVMSVTFINNKIIFFLKQWTDLSNITNYYYFSSHLIPQELPTQCAISADFKVPSSSSHVYSLMFQNFTINIMFKTHIPEIICVCIYKVVQIWPGLFVCKSGDISPGHIWTTLYMYIQMRQKELPYLRSE